MAIDDLLDEHEQSERVLQWLRKNALGMIGGVVIGIGLIWGWNWWSGHREQQRVAAGQHYRAALADITAGNLDKAAAQAKGAEGTYAGIVALDLAKAQHDAGKREEAIATLRGTEIRDAALAAVAKQRLARLLIDAGKGEEALTLLAGATGADAIEARGDAQFALGRAEDAQKSYAEALARTDVASPQYQLLSLKLAGVGGKAPGAEGEG